MNVDLVLLTNMAYVHTHAHTLYTNDKPFKPIIKIEKREKSFTATLRKYFYRYFYIPYSDPYSNIEPAKPFKLNGRKGISFRLNLKPTSHRRYVERNPFNRLKVIGTFVRILLLMLPYLS